MPDTTSVRSLITSVTELANHLGVTPNAIYRWINIDRIPARNLIKVAAYYDVPIPVHLAQSDKKNEVKINYKPKDTLPTCLQVQAGELDLDEAAERLGIHRRAIQLILTNWGDSLKTLYEVMLALEKKEVSLDQAAERLGVSKYNIHALRKKYGFRPEPRKAKEERPIVQRRQTARHVALECIAGRMPLADVEKHCDLSWRTIHRAIAKLSPEYSMIDLTHWPKAFREAYAMEIDKDLPRISVKLWKFAKISGIQLKKWPKYPENPTNWRKITLKRMMAHVLLGDETLDSAAEKRGADPVILASLFTSDLRMVGLTWEEAKGSHVLTQLAIAELLLAIDEGSKTPRERMLERLSEDKEN